VGAGAVGGLYGARLAAAGHDVHFLVRSSADQLRREGLHVRSVDGDIDLPAPSIADDPGAVPAVDVVLVALKTTANDALPAILPHLVGPGTVVVMLQNGLGVEALAAACVPGTVVLGGLCFVCSSLVAPGRIEHVDYGAVTLGEHRADGAAAGVTPAVEAVAADLAAAGVTVQAQPDLVAARWKKLVWNVPYNGLSVVLGAGTDELMADPDARALVRTLMEEVQQGARSQGREVPDAFVDQMLADTEAMTPYRTSMALDFDHRRPLELGAIYRAPIAQAAAAGVALPVTAALCEQLAMLDRRNRDVR
jgi:2-dehydropantoate 2-reductase